MGRQSSAPSPGDQPSSRGLDGDGYPETGIAPLSPRTAEAVADVMFALSAPSRVGILGLLRERPRSVGELMSALEMEQSAVSHQLRVLREHQLVRATELGRRRMYELSGEGVVQLLEDAVAHVSRQSGASDSEPSRRRRLRRAR